MHDLTIVELEYQLDEVVKLDDPNARDFIINFVVQSWGDLDKLGDMILIGTPGCGWDKLTGLLRLWCHPAVIVLEIPQRSALLAHANRPKIITCMEQDLKNMEASLGNRPWTKYVYLGEDRRRHVIWKKVSERFAHRRAQHWVIE
jgi:hypothetical protein